MTRTKPSSETKPKAAASPSELIDARIAALGDWRGAALARVRALITEAVPDVVEAVKWRKPSNPLGVPVWEHAGVICTGETYKDKVKLTFAKGAALKDPSGVFNASLEGNVRRAIDLGDGDNIDAKAFKALVRAAAALNGSKPKAGAKAKPASTAKGATAVLLSGGNPQIAKADGDAPVQAYIAALPGWKRDLCARLDALVARTVPGVRRAVKWNSPFYGVEGQGWFLALHTFKHYVKLAFFRGASLWPVPPGGSKSKDTRYLDIREGDALDEAQLADWLRQAAALPGFMAPRR